MGQRPERQRETAGCCLETSWRRRCLESQPGEDAGNPGYSRHRKAQIVSGYTAIQALSSPVKMLLAPFRPGVVYCE